MWCFLIGYVSKNISLGQLCPVPGGSVPLLLISGMFSSITAVQVTPAPIVWFLFFSSFSFPFQLLPLTFYFLLILHFYFLFVFRSFFNITYCIFIWISSYYVIISHQSVIISETKSLNLHFFKVLEFSQQFFLYSHDASIFVFNFSCLSSFLKKYSLFGGYLIEFVVIVYFFFLFEGNGWGEGTSVTWDALGPSHGDLCSWGGTITVSVCAPMHQVSVFVLRVLARERVLGGPRAACWLGPCTPSLGPGVPRSPSLFCHLPTPGQPLSSEPPHSHPAAGRPLPLSLVLGSSQTLPVWFLSLDSQGGFSSCASSC